MSSRLTSIESIDIATETIRKAGALLRAAEQDPRGRDRAWLVSMALEAVEQGERATDGLNAVAASTPTSGA